MKKVLRPALFRHLLSCLLLIWVVNACKWNLDPRSFPACTSPAATISYQAKLLDVTYSLSALTGTTDDVAWDFGDGKSGSSAGSASISHTYGASGTYTVKATLTNKCGDSNTATATVLVNNVTSPIVTIQDPTSITISSATLRMTVTSNGNGVIKEYGLCYSSSNHSPTIADSRISSTSNPTINVVNSFTAVQLKPATVYYVRAYAINNSGTQPAYSSDVKMFTTAPEPPIVSTIGTSAVDRSNATVLFRLDNPGTPTATRYGVCYSSSTDKPDISNSSTVDITSPGVGINVPVSLTNLSTNTTYYYCTFAVYDNGKVVYGPILPFTTLDFDLTTGLIASYSFDGNANDVSGNGNHGVLMNGPTFTTNRKGSDQSAIYFDGVDDYVEVADKASLRPAGISISVWIKPTSKALTSRMHIFMKNRFSDGEFEQYSAILREIESSTSATSTKPGINFDIKQKSNCVQKEGWQDSAIPNQILMDTWQHLVFVYSSTTMIVYHNGKVIRTITGLPQTFMDDCPGGTLKFGAQSKNFPNYFQGAMDDIRVYSIPLNQDQVTALYSRQ